MTTQRQTTPFTQTLIPAVKWAERIATAAFIASLVAVFVSKGAQMDFARNIFTISSAILAATYFLNAFLPMNFQPPNENEKIGMMDLVVTTILPKVLWIACAICMCGFYILSQNEEHNAHLNLFFMGGFTMVGALPMLALAIIGGNKNASVIAPVAFRAVPLLALVIYFYLNS